MYWDYDETDLPDATIDRAIMLQQMLSEPYQHMALDQFRDGMPGKYRGLNSPKGTQGDLGLNVVPIEKDG